MEMETEIYRLVVVVVRIPHQEKKQNGLVDVYEGRFADILIAASGAV